MASHNANPASAARLAHRCTDCENRLPDCRCTPCPLCGGHRDRCSHTEDHFRCVICGAIRLQPPASSDDYEIDEGHWRACGQPICGPCTRATTSVPEYARYMTDGSD